MGARDSIIACFGCKRCKIPVEEPKRGRHTELMSPLNYAGTIHSHTQIHTYIHLYTEKTQTHPDHFKSIKTARAPRYQEFWGLRGWPRTVPVV